MKYFLTISLLLTAGICFSQADGRRRPVSVELQSSRQRVDVKIDGKLFTSYYFPGPDLVKKPVLYPVYSPGGSLVTRGWPLDPRPGERVDHPHHIGIWFNYEDVNGNDFWNNSIQVGRSEKKYGTILNTKIVGTTSGKEKGTLTATSDWVDHSGKRLLIDTTHIIFHTRGKPVYVIDYEVVLSAPDEDVFFKDVKDGMFAIRMARELELKYKEPQLLTGEDGKAMKEKIVDNERVSGSYFNKEGIKDDEAWGKPSAWCAMAGKIGKEDVTVAILDHPANFGYLAGRWHARGYGLFALNPVARKAYDKDQPPLEFRIRRGESARFRFRVVVASQKLGNVQLDRLQQEFASQK